MRVNPAHAQDRGRKSPYKTGRSQRGGLIINASLFSRGQALPATQLNTPISCGGYFWISTG